MSIVSDVTSELKTGLKPAKILSTAIIVIVILWGVVLLSKKFSWFKKVDPLSA
ncbi:MAG: hypothetical protein WC394_02895 [Candidatus Omnitrophota bacterium]|jgi:hypothetical protein